MSDVNYKTAPIKKISIGAIIPRPEKRGHRAVVKARQKLRKTIARKLAEALLAGGYVVAQNKGCTQIGEPTVHLTFYIRAVNISDSRVDSIL